jgi:penicillin-binding protein 1A
MKCVLGLAALLMGLTSASARTDAAEVHSFWDLKPEHLRLLVASPQVMVTRTASGWDAYCRCPVILRPHEIPEFMKRAIIAVEDKRYMDHGGVDLIGLLSVLRDGLSRGGSTIPMQLLKNLVFHDLQGRDMLSKLERKQAEIWHASTFDGTVGKQELLAAYLNQIEFGGRDIVGLCRASRHYFRKEPKDLNAYEAAMLAGMVQAPARFNPLRQTTKGASPPPSTPGLRLDASASPDHQGRAPSGSTAWHSPGAPAGVQDSSAGLHRMGHPKLGTAVRQGG